MARILGYIAASLDGFIADNDESLDWLTGPSDFELGEHHYDLFVKDIRTIVMGRMTYDWVIRSGSPWPYGAQRTIVVTSRPILDPPAPIETRTDVDALVAELRALDDGNIWMAGAAGCRWRFWSAARVMKSKSTSRQLCWAVVIPSSLRLVFAPRPSSSRRKR